MPNAQKDTRPIIERIEEGRDELIEKTGQLSGFVIEIGNTELRALKAEVRARANFTVSDPKLPRGGEWFEGMRIKHVPAKYHMRVVQR